MNGGIRNPRQKCQNDVILFERGGNKRGGLRSCRGYEIQKCL